MANELNTIPSGMKLHLGFDVPMGKTPEFNMICSFARALDESSFLISIPMLGGKALVLDEDQKFLIRYNQGEEYMILAAYADDVVKDGIRRYWKMRRVSESRQFFMRRDERIKVALRTQYHLPTAPLREDGTVAMEDAMTLDISDGGAALFINSRYDVGEALELTLPRVGLDPEGAEVRDILAIVCWCREAPKGSIYRFVTGLQYRMGDGTQREQIADYVAYVKKKYKL